MVLEWSGQGYGRPSGHDASFGIDDKPLEGLIHSNHCVIRWDTTRNQVLWSRCKMQDAVSIKERWESGCTCLDSVRKQAVHCQLMPSETLVYAFITSLVCKL